MQTELPNGLARDKLKKHVAAIHISADLSMLERKLSNVLLLNAYDELLTERTHRLPVAILTEFLGWENGRNTSALKDALRTLTSTPVEFDVMKDGPDGEWSVTSILSFAQIKGGVCTYRYDESMAEKLYNPAIYATISAGLQRKFSGGYALALYENVSRYVRVGSTGFWDLATLRKLLGVTQEYYDDFRRLKSKVIQKAVAEINRESDITITKVDLQKAGRTVTAVRFLLEAKPQAQLFTHGENAELERLKVSPVYKKLREHGIGERLALEVLAGGDQDRIERIVRFAEEKDKRGEIRHTTAGFIRRLIESGADIQPSPQQKRREEAIAQQLRERAAAQESALRAEWETSVKKAAVQQLTPDQLVTLAARFVETEEGRLYRNDFSPNKQEPFPAGAPRVAFRRWLPDQVGLSLTEEAFEAFKRQGGHAA
nr:Protein involved in initiation of plasmid replication [Cupriavidus gilardii]